MKPLLMDALGEEGDVFRRRNLAREFLQARVLLSLQDHGAFNDWAFLGGTALRFLFRLPRYSEDLDFSLVSADGDARFEKRIEWLQHDLSAEAYDVATRVRARGAVAAAHIKFRGILYEIGVSPHRDEVFMVKVEIDTNPLAGAVTTSRLVRRFMMLNLLHYDRASLLAGKLHAVLTRRYTKGRDLYDLAWYLADPDWPAPNVTLLRNALHQTGWEGPDVTERNWRHVIAEKLDSVDWKQAGADVAPFLERKQDLALVSPETLLPLLKPNEE